MFYLSLVVFAGMLAQVFWEINTHENSFILKDILVYVSFYSSKMTCLAYFYVPGSISWRVMYIVENWQINNFKLRRLIYVNVCVFTRQETPWTLLGYFMSFTVKRVKRFVTIHGYACNSDKNSYNQLGCIKCRPNAEQSNCFPFFSWNTYNNRSCIRVSRRPL